MKKLIFILPFVLILLLVSCDNTSPQEELTESEYNYDFLLAKSFAQNTQLILETNRHLLFNIEQITAEKTTFIAIGVQAKNIDKITTDFLTEIDKLKIELDKEGVATFLPKAKSLAIELGEYKREILRLYGNLWNESIKVGIFNHPYEKNDQLSQLEKALNTSIDAENNTSSLFKNKNSIQILTSLEKIKSDICTQEKTILQQLYQQISNNGHTVIYDKFTILQSPKKGAIKLGETYESILGLGIYSTQAYYTIKVNGENVKIKDGLALYKATPITTGEKILNVTINIKNPLTAETETFRKIYTYEVIPNNE